jgi:hypothetical protein
MISSYDFMHGDENWSDIDYDYDENEDEKYEQWRDEQMQKIYNN